MAKTQVKEITVDGVVYIPQDSVRCMAPEVDGMEYCIVRTYSAGVFAGYLESRNGQEVVMRDARRLYYWDGAATLSQLAVDGVAAPQNCKFPTEVPTITLTQAIEVIPCTAKAQASIKAVAVWKR